MSNHRKRSAKPSYYDLHREEFTSNRLPMAIIARRAKQKLQKKLLKKKKKLQRAQEEEEGRPNKRRRLKDGSHKKKKEKKRRRHHSSHGEARGSSDAEDVQPHVPKATSSEEEDHAVTPQNSDDDSYCRVVAPPEETSTHNGWQCQREYYEYMLEQYLPEEKRAEYLAQKDEKETLTRKKKKDLAKQNKEKEDLAKMKEKEEPRETLAGDCLGKTSNTAIEIDLDDEDEETEVAKVVNDNKDDASSSQPSEEDLPFPEDQRLANETNDKDIPEEEAAATKHQISDEEESVAVQNAALQVTNSTNAENVVRLQDLQASVPPAKPQSTETQATTHRIRQEEEHVATETDSLHMMNNSDDRESSSQSTVLPLDGETEVPRQQETEVSRQQEAAPLENENAADEETATNNNKSHPKSKVDYLEPWHDVKPPASIDSPPWELKKAQSIRGNYSSDDNVSRVLWTEVASESKKASADPIEVAFDPSKRYSAVEWGVEESGDEELARRFNEIKDVLLKDLVPVSDVDVDDNDECEMEVSVTDSDLNERNVKPPRVSESPSLRSTNNESEEEKFEDDNVVSTIGTKQAKTIKNPRRVSRSPTSMRSDKPNSESRASDEDDGVLSKPAEGISPKVVPSSSRRVSTSPTSKKASSSKQGNESKLGASGYISPLVESEKNKAEWNASFERFKKKHKNGEVPSWHKDLFRWVQTQRRAYANNELSESHIKILEAAGFTWQKHQKTQSDDSSSLDFQETSHSGGMRCLKVGVSHGVDKSEKSKTTLEVVDTIQDEEPEVSNDYEDVRESGRSTPELDDTNANVETQSLSEDACSMNDVNDHDDGDESMPLVSTGSSDDEKDDEAEWNDCFELLRGHIKKYKHSFVTKQFKKYQKIFDWVKIQRRAYSEKQLSLPRQKKLETIGFSRKWKEGAANHLSVKDDKSCCFSCEGDHGDGFMMCEVCDTGAHIQCLRVPLKKLPKEPWFCENHSSNTADAQCTASEIPELSSNAFESSETSSSESESPESSSSDSEFLDTQAVIPRMAQVQLEDDTFQNVESQTSIYDDTLCMICTSNHGEGMLVCYECDSGCHMQCLNPPLAFVPEGQWYCCKCSSNTWCLLCGLDHDEDKILSCCKCEDSYHMHCLSPALNSKPDEDWYCGLCSPVVTPSSPRDQRKGPRAKGKRSKAFDESPDNPEQNPVASENKKRISSIAKIPDTQSIVELVMGMPMSHEMEAVRVCERIAKDDRCKRLVQKASRRSADNIYPQYPLRKFEDLWSYVEENELKMNVAKDIEDNKEFTAANRGLNSKNQESAQYGRVHPLAMNKILRKFMKLKPGQTFVDLGHEIGNACLQAAFTIGCHSKGVELVDARYHASEALHRSLCKAAIEIREYAQSKKASDAKGRSNVPQKKEDTNWDYQPGTVNLRHGRLEDPKKRAWLIDVDGMFVNNYNRVFSDRGGTTTKSVYCLDNRIAALFAQMKEGAVLVTLEKLTFPSCLPQERAVQEREKHKVLDKPRSKKASFYKLEQLKLGEANKSVSWSIDGGNTAPIMVYKYTRTKQGESQAVFLCNNTNCEKARKAVPIKAIVDKGNDEGLVLNSCDCNVSQRETRSKENRKPSRKVMESRGAKVD